MSPSHTRARVAPLRPVIDHGAERAGKVAPAAWAMAAALVLLPVAMHVPVSADRLVPLLFLPAWGLAVRTSSPSAARSDLIAAIIAGAAALLGAACARNPAAALVMTAAAFLALSGGEISRRLARDPRAIRVISGGMVAGGCLGLFLLIGGWGELRMTFPTYGSARLFGGHEFVASAAGLALLIERKRRDRVFWLVATGTAITWTALAWSGSRAPALGLAVALTFWFFRANPETRRRLLIWPPILAVIALAASRPLGTPYSQLGWWPALTRTVEAAGTGSARAITSERTDYWRATWDAIRASPWVGHGADAYQFLEPKQPGNQPHNTYLQWWLEYGAAGALALGWLLLRTLAPRRRKREACVTLESAELDYFSRWAGAAMGGAAVYAAFEGAAFHMAMFMPLAVVGGLSIGTRASAAPVMSRGVSWPWRAVVLTAVALLLVHNWLSLMLTRGRHVEPDSPAALALRSFPSTTHGLQNWTERWRRDQPEVAAEWISWSQGISANAGALHVHAAQIHLWNKNWAAAEKELLACLPKVLPSEQPDVLELLANLRRFVAEQTPAATSLPNSTPAIQPAP